MKKYVLQFLIIFSLLPPKISFSTNPDTINIPYPFIILHGITSNGDKWIEFKNDAIDKGWVFGGQLNYCLNSDGLLSQGEIISDVTSFVDEDSLIPGSFYIINFNVDEDGTYYGSSTNTSSQSNQASIIKQAYALKLAIQSVLNVSGRDKVILMAHSMGGLASRAYIQNPDLWQNDGEHHVAKLLTSATPHGGSNFSVLNITSLFGYTDERSEAVRDLRSTYDATDSNGVFLYGGIENKDYIDGSILTDYYNLDVNGNGTENDSIEGLNEKNLASNVEYACVIGDYFLDFSGGDLIVSTYSANINNFYPINAETFTVNENHFNITDNIKMHYKGFDEPDTSIYAYEVLLNKTYNGYTTQQANSILNKDTDKDFYIFTLDINGEINIQVDSLQSTNTTLHIYSKTWGVIIYSLSTTTNALYSGNVWLPAGEYYLEIITENDNDSWKKPYYFIINNSLITTYNNYASPNIIIFPIPAKNELNIMSDKNTEYTLFTIEGKELFKGEIMANTINTISLNNEISSGVLWVVFKNNDGSIVTRKIIH